MNISQGNGIEICRELKCPNMSYTLPEYPCRGCYTPDTCCYECPDEKRCNFHTNPNYEENKFKYMVLKGCHVQSPTLDKGDSK